MADATPNAPLARAGEVDDHRQCGRRVSDEGLNLIACVPIDREGDPIAVSLVEVCNRRASEIVSMTAVYLICSDDEHDSLTFSCSIDGESSIETQGGQSSQETQVDINQAKRRK
jgi:hypothetical protein